MKIEGDYLYAMGSEGKRFGVGQPGDQYRVGDGMWINCREYNFRINYDPAPDCEIRRPIGSCSPDLLREAITIDPFLDHYL